MQTPAAFLRKHLTTEQQSRLWHLKERIYGVFESALRAGVSRLPARLRLSLKAGTDVVVPLDLPDPHPLLLNVNSTLDLWVRAKSCVKEPETVEWIRNSMSSTSVFFDIGANVGAYALVAGRLIESPIRIYAFEPAYMNYSQLCRNIILNDLSACIVPFPIALSDQTTIGIFNFQNLESGSALHTLGAAVDHLGRQFKPLARQHVLSYRLDDLMQAFKLPQPTHLKIDVDGVEFQILKGAERTLANVESVLIEIQPGEEREQILEYLASKGLRYHSHHAYAYSQEAGSFSPGENYIFRRVS